ncbi:hydrolase 76 protein [Ciborinia camelliae]|nr:hydrolase 76 protein [Ciborinia camelliae]
MTITTMSFLHEIPSIRGNYAKDIINTQFTSTAQAAAKTCGDNGCPFNWSGKATSSSNSGSMNISGLGELIHGPNYVRGILYNRVATPATQNSSNTTNSSGSGLGDSTSTGTSASASATKNAAMGMMVRQSVLSFSILGEVTWLVF